jgi:exonuclease SbcD
MKKVGVIFNDLHLTIDNVEEINNLVDQVINYCLDNKIKTAFLAGDLLDSRSSLRIDEVQAILNIKEKFSKAKIDICVIPGNHDKTRYDSPNSWLDIWTPQDDIRKGMSMLIREVDHIVLDNLAIFMLPYYREELLVPMIEGIEPIESKTNILISHFAMNGSVNNDGSKMETGITSKLLKKFKFVYLGHYHNTHKPCRNTLHLPSICQNNFGEDENKGFTVLFEDGSHEIVNTNFRRFKNVKIDLDTITPAKLNKAIKQYANSSDNIKFKILGSEEKVKAFKKEKLEDVGIVCEKIYNEEIGEVEKNDTSEIKLKKTDEEIISIFENFCKVKDYNFEEGLKYMKDE